MSGKLRTAIDLENGDGEVVVVSINDAMPRRIIQIKTEDENGLKSLTVILSPAEAKVLAKALDVEP